jgi:vitamin B12 transporter
MKYTLLYIIAIIPLLCVSKAKADILPGDTIHLKEVIVPAKKPELQHRSPVPIQVLHATQIEQVSGSSAAEALKGFSGVTIRDYGGIGGLKTIMVRSLGAGHTGVFVDGMPINDAASGQADLGRVPLQGLDQVNLFIGQPMQLLQPARYFAWASVVSMQSIQPNREKKENELKLGIRAGSFGLYNPFLFARFNPIANTRGDVQVNFTKAHGRYPYNIQNSGKDSPDVFRENTDVQNINLTFGLNHQLNSHDQIRFRIWYHDSERGLPGAVVLYNPHATERLWNKDLFFNLQYERKPPGKLNLLSGSGFSRTWLRYLDPDYLGLDGELENVYTQHEFYFSQAITYPFFQNIEFSLSSDLFLESLQANLQNFAGPTRFNWLTSFVVQAQFNRFETQAGMLASVIREQTQAGAGSPARNKLDPFVALNYRITSGEPLLRARVMYKSIFRMPTFNELYYSLVGNPNVRPENADQLNAGMMLSWHAGPSIRIMARSDVFYNRVTDKIVTVPTRNLFTWSVQNIGVVDIRGLEWQVHAEHDITQTLTVSTTLNYTFQRAVDITNPIQSTYKNQIPYIPRETFFSRGALTWQDVSMGYSSLFNGYRYILGENVFENMMPSWWHHDVFVGWKHQWGKTGLELRLEVNNLFDHRYEVIKSFPMPGRGYFVRVGIEL